MHCVDRGQYSEMPWKRGSQLMVVGEAKNNKKHTHKGRVVGSPPVRASRPLCHRVQVSYLVNRVDRVKELFVELGCVLRGVPRL